MLRRLVRPGITGWAQVNDLWSLWFDLKILFLTVFGGKFKNDEQIN